VVALWKDALADRIEVGVLDAAAIEELLVSVLCGPVDAASVRQLVDRCVRRADQRRPGPGAGSRAGDPVPCLAKPGRAELTGSSGRGWLFTVAKRIVIDQWRSATRRPVVLTDQVPDQTVEDTAQQTVDRQLVLAALQTLSIEYRRTLFETYFRGASVAEAAETLGVPPGTVKSRTHYALHALRQAIDGMAGVV